MRYVIVGGLATEEVSNELLLCDASGSAVHRLSGDGRRYFERVRDGEGSLPDDEVTAALVAAQVITPSVGDAGSTAAGTPGVATPPVDVVSRRRAMAIGAAAVAAAGVVTVGLPSAAAAQSPGPAPAPEDPTYPDPPEEGTSPGLDASAGVDTQLLSDGTRRTRFDWETVNGDGVTYNWKLYSPGNLNVPSNLIAQGGPVTGRTAFTPVPGAVEGQSILWVVTAVGGTTTYFTTSFPD